MYTTMRIVICTCILYIPYVHSIHIACFLYRMTYLFNRILYYYCYRWMLRISPIRQPIHIYGDWEVYSDDNNTVFYFNRATFETSYDVPADLYYEGYTAHAHAAHTEYTHQPPHTPHIQPQHEQYIQQQYQHDNTIYNSTTLSTAPTEGMYSYMYTDQSYSQHTEEAGSETGVYGDNTTASVASFTDTSEQHMMMYNNSLVSSLEDEEEA